jgi:hypothetical protein
MTESAHRGATLDDFWAIPEAERFHESIAGEITSKAAPSGEHGGLIALERAALSCAPRPD